MYKHTISELRSKLDAKEISSYELTKYFLDRIKHFDEQVNSFITVTAEQALQAARHIDNHPSANSSPLRGIPIAHKDIFCTKVTKWI